MQSQKKRSNTIWRSRASRAREARLDERPGQRELVELGRVERGVAVEQLERPPRRPDPWVRPWPRLFGLNAARQPHHGGAIPQVPANLALHAPREVCPQRLGPVRIGAVDRADECERPDLDEVFARLPEVREPGHDVVHER